MGGWFLRPGCYWIFCLRFVPTILYRDFPVFKLRVISRVCRRRPRNIFFYLPNTKIECTFVTELYLLSKVSGGVFGVASPPDILSIKKFSPPCQRPSESWFYCCGSTSNPAFRMFHLGRRLRRRHEFAPDGVQRQRPLHFS